MKSLLIVDTVCPKPYSRTILNTEGLGGTEATVIRVAERLALMGVKVDVAQHSRAESVQENGVGYKSFASIEPDTYKNVIVLRDPAVLMSVRQQAPKSRLFLWAHDLINDRFMDLISEPAVAKATIVCVSQWHLTQLREAMRGIGVLGAAPTTFVYNPVDDSYTPDETPVDINSLVFFSSPHKGLDDTLQVFKNLLSFVPEMRLTIANPGYFKSADTTGIENVNNIGAVPQSEVIKHVRKALAVFHINRVFPETFGIVHAEAHAVGTPFLTQKHGAAYELHDHPSELVDCSNPKEIIDRVLHWRNGNRPRVRLHGRFRLAAVAKEWYNLLNDTFSN